MNTDKLGFFLWGLIIGFILGAIVRSAVVYAFLTVKGWIKDWIRKRKEGNFKLGRNITKGRAPKLMSLDDD